MYIVAFYITFSHSFCTEGSITSQTRYICLTQRRFYLISETFTSFSQIPLGTVSLSTTAMTEHQYDVWDTQDPSTVTKPLTLIQVVIVMLIDQFFFISTWPSFMLDVH